MRCGEFHELAPGYALDALSEEERLACERHLRDEGPHDGCEALVARYQHAAGTLTALVPSQPPPPSLWRAIELRLGFKARAARRPSRLRELTAWAAAAAALLAALWMRNDIGRSVHRLERERNTAEQALANTSDELASVEQARKECAQALTQLGGRGVLGRDAVSMLEHPATRITSLQPTGTQGYRATALYNRETKRALIVSSTMSPVAGKDYELWVIARGETKPRPAGFLRFGAGGVAVGELDETLLREAIPAAFAVSLEPAGGRPTPTEVVLLGKVQG